MQQHVHVGCFFYISSFFCQAFYWSANRREVFPLKKRKGSWCILLEKIKECSLIPKTMANPCSSLFLLAGKHLKSLSLFSPSIILYLYPRIVRLTINFWHKLLYGSFYINRTSTLSPQVKKKTRHIVVRQDYSAGKVGTSFSH